MEKVNNRKRTKVKVSLFSWGDNGEGQLGIGAKCEPALLPVPADVSSARSVLCVSSGLAHSLLLRRDGSLMSCGSNQHFQLGHRPQVTTKFSQIMALEHARIVSASAGGNHSAAVTDLGKVLAWGLNDKGQLGREDEVGDSVKIVRQLEAHRVAFVAAGAAHTLAVTVQHTLFAFGDNAHGQLGVGSFQSVHGVVPVTSLQGLPIKCIAAGGLHSAVLSHSGVLFTWGCNARGQLGCGNTEPQAWPKQCRQLRTQNAVYIACGHEHTAVLTGDGGVFTFGCGAAGQLGHGVRTDELLPRKVVDLMGSVVTQIACGRMHTLALVPSTGRLYGFGLASSGQLGVGSADCNRVSATLVKGPWVPADGKRQFLMRQISVEGLNESYTPLLLMCGGDQSFVKAVQPPSDLLPDDFRVRPPSALSLAPQLLRVDRLLADAAAAAAADADEAAAAAAAASLKLLVRSASTALACYNCSFLLPDATNPCRAAHGLDLDRAASELGKIANFKKSDQDQLLASLIELLGTVRTRNNYPDVECLRFLLLLPFLPAFEQPQLYDSVHTDYAHCLLYLHQAPMKILHSWLADMPTRYFARLVRLYIRVVLHIIDLPKHSSHAERMIKDRGINNALDLLKRLHQVNADRHRHQVLPASSFYIPEINDKVDISTDYVNWRQQSRRSSSGLLFSFCHYPFIFDGLAKTKLLCTDAQLQMQQAVQQAQAQNMMHGLFPLGAAGLVNPFLVLHVRRDNLVGDAISHLGKYPPEEFKKPLKVKFVGEDAEDEGGVAKEFFQLIFKEILNPVYGMFRCYDSRLLWFNTGTLEDARLFHLIGILCGLAIYNNFLAAVAFPLVMYKKLLGREPALDDLKELDPVVGANMQQLLDAESPEAVEALCLTFEIELDFYGELRKIPLADNPDEPVTIGNRQQFVDAYVNHVLSVGCQQQYDAFHTGFHKVCGGAVLQMFEPQELQSMLVGDQDNFDWQQLQRNAEYLGVYFANHEVIQRFWSVFHRDLTEAQKRKFLLFLTGCDRVPMQGMAAVKIRIQPAHGGHQFLPVAHTCYNLLDLPLYPDAELLRRKLTQAIEQTEGFALV